MRAPPGALSNRDRGGIEPTAAAPDVVIWEADGRAAAGGYGRPIARRLLRAGLSVITVSLVERPPDLREMAAPMHVISGGDTAVDSDVAWLATARERLAWLLDEALAGNRSVTGICFGAQLIAHLLAGTDSTGPHREGLQVGLFPLRDDVGQVVSSFHYHRICRDAVERAGATVLVDSDRTEVQAFRFGDRVRGVQFHPELAPIGLSRTVRAYRDVLDRHGASAATVAANVAALRHSWSDRPWHEYVAEPARTAAT